MNATRVLVAHASKRGSTAEIAQVIGETLGKQGLEVDVRPVDEVDDLTPYRAVLVGSAVYMFRWRHSAVRFLRRHREELAKRAVWLFQSGPMDDSAERGPIALPKKMAALAAEVGARGHETFGGRLAPDAEGFMARKMVEGGHGGDFRNFDRVRAWAGEVARSLSAPAAYQPEPAPPM